MLQYIPAEWIKIGPFTGLEGPAFVVSLTRQEAKYVVTGGDDPQAIFVGGDLAGKSFRQKAVADTSGLAIEGIEIEIDLTSLLPRSHSEVPTCSLALTDNGFHIFATAQTQFGFEDIFAWNLQTGVGSEHFAGRAIFTRWRICKRDEERLIEILAVAAERPSE